MNIWTRKHTASQVLWLLGLGGIGLLVSVFVVERAGNGVIITGLLLDIKGAGSVVLGAAESGGVGGTQQWWQLGGRVNPRGAWAFVFLVLGFGLQIVGTCLNDCASPL